MDKKHFKFDIFALLVISVVAIIIVVLATISNIYSEDYSLKMMEKKNKNLKLKIELKRLENK